MKIENILKTRLGLTFLKKIKNRNLVSLFLLSFLIQLSVLADHQKKSTVQSKDTSFSLSKLMSQAQELSKKNLQLFLVVGYFSMLSCAPTWYYRWLTWDHKYFASSGKQS